MIVLKIFRYIRRLLPVQTVTSASITELEKGLRRISFEKEQIKTVKHMQSVVFIFSSPFLLSLV